ncbi:MAG: protein kinase [Melioribacteraceae bacterium]|nr:protein kinase [Melioribacteraceae bacterium]MCF8354984.1 protein kinase [Melioribacteraceae bacterium]MCF8393999.1 protein kinase [Melioribacteraceae bacterium]
MRKVLLSVIIFAFLSACSDVKITKLNEKEKAPDDLMVWYKQLTVDLGTRIEMESTDLGYAISRGRGEDVKGRVYIFENNKWKSIAEHDYSDYPLVKKYNDESIWYVFHETHHGDYRPRHFQYKDGKKTEIPLPKIMWDAVDYVMWKDLHVNDDGTAWMVGQQGHIIYYDGTKWIEVFSPVKKFDAENFSAGDLNNIDMINKNEGWAAGKNGIILKYSDGKWIRYESPVSMQLLDVDMLNSSKGYIVGERGTFLELTNGKWEIVNLNINESLVGIKALSEDQIYVSGSNSTLLEFNGTEWEEIEQVKIYDDDFGDIEVVENPDGGLDLYLIGNAGIYTTSQALGFSFTNITLQSALRTVGKAGLFTDFNNDDLPELLVLNEAGQALLFENTGRNNFRESSSETITEHKLKWVLAAATGDVNNDGNPDLFEIQDNQNFRLLLGDGNLDFKDITQRSNIKLDYIEAGSHISADLIDFDNDGNLDLYVSNFNSIDRYFKNDGTGKFTDVSGSTGINKSLNAMSFGATFSDFNNDGLVDVLIPYRINIGEKHLDLFLNTGNFRFYKKHDPNFNSSIAILTFSTIAEDFNNDGYSDIFMYNNGGAVRLLINDGTASFENKAVQAGLNYSMFHPEPGNGIINAADINNDGWVDLFVGSRLFLNNSEMKFTETANQVGLQFAGNPVFADTDNDGDYDLFLGSSQMSMGEGIRAALFRNNLIANNFLKIKLNPDKSNRSGVGTQIIINAADEKGAPVYKNLYQVGLGSSPISNKPVGNITFGLQDIYHYTAEVKFPSGEQKLIDDIKPNSLIEINESDIITHNYALILKSVNRSILHLQTMNEIIKLIILLILFGIVYYFFRKSKSKKLLVSFYYYPLLIIGYILITHFTIENGQVESAVSALAAIAALSFGSVIAYGKAIELKESKYISHFKLDSIIGEGGMGRVYKAIDTQSKEIVALKVLNQRLMNDPENRRRLSNEGRLLAMMNHPYIVKVFEVGESEEHSFIAMEYLPGGTLQDYIDRNFPLSKELLIDIIIQMCKGLEAIHEKGVIHRDFKSPNVMFDDKGKIRIMDFGLSKSPLVSTMTSLGTVVGTLGYVAPEQVTSIDVDKRTDIFSFGVVMYELLTNQMPFKGENEIALIHSIFNTHPLKPSELNSNLDPRFDEIVIKSIAKEPKDRYNNISEILEAVENIK